MFSDNSHQAPFLHNLKKVFWSLDKKGNKIDLEHDVNPDAVGNKSRICFLHHPFFSEIGKRFQYEIKGSLIKLIGLIHEKLDPNTPDEKYKPLHEALINSIKTNIVHESDRLHPTFFQVADIVIHYAQNPDAIKQLSKNKRFRGIIGTVHKGLRAYDKDAYVFDDLRLQEFLGIFKNEIIIYWKGDETLIRASEGFVFLMKEDIRYRRFFIQLLKDTEPVVSDLAKVDRSIFIIGLCRLCDSVKNMELTKEEIVNAQLERIESDEFFRQSMITPEACIEAYQKLIETNPEMGESVCRVI